jgi:hypothetical protein
MSDMTTLSDKQVQDQVVSFSESMFQTTGIDKTTFEFIVTMKKYKNLQEFVHTLCCFTSPWMYQWIYDTPFEQWVQLSQIFSFKKKDWKGQQKEFHQWCIVFAQFRCNHFEQFWVLAQEMLRRVNEQNHNIFKWTKINDVPVFGGIMMDPKWKPEDPGIYPTTPGVQMVFIGHEDVPKVVEVEDE